MELDASGREMAVPWLARFRVARFRIPPRRGNDMPAQGNALGAAIPRKRVPCKGATSLGYRDVPVAREKPNSVSPRQGSSGPRALPWADLWLSLRDVELKAQHQNGRVGLVWGWKWPRGATLPLEPEASGGQHPPTDWSRREGEPPTRPVPWRISAADWGRLGNQPRRRCVVQAHCEAPRGRSVGSGLQKGSGCLVRVRVENWVRSGNLQGRST